MSKHQANIRYFAITGAGGSVDDPDGMFREMTEEGGDFRFERFDLANRCWVEDFDSLAPYIFKGEVGAVEISRYKAAQLEQMFFAKAFRVWRPDEENT